MRRGDVVLLDYPFSDASGSKVRPALVVQADDWNAKLNSTVVALITRNLQHVQEPSQTLIDISTAEGKQSGLRANSAAVCTSLFTVHQRHVLHTIGNMPALLMQRIDACLKASLGIK
jgi:mRNA interferase MazF